MEGELFLVFHLMIAGRFRWRKSAKKTSTKVGKIGLATFELPNGLLFLTEAGSKKRASLHVVHGKYGKPCGLCGSTVQRIRYAENETNYCPSCQTGVKLLADRSLSRLLKKDWPKSMEDLEG